jgi:hypothetical protein
MALCTLLLDYSMLILAPLITFILSKVDVVAPGSNFTVATTSPPPPEHLVSMGFLEIYASQTMVICVGVVTGLAVLLSLLHCILALGERGEPVWAPWEDESTRVAEPRNVAIFNSGARRRETGNRSIRDRPVRSAPESTGIMLGEHYYPPTEGIEMSPRPERARSTTGMAHNANFQDLSADSDASEEEDDRKTVYFDH